MVSLGNAGVTSNEQLFSHATLILLFSVPLRPDVTGTHCLKARTRRFPLLYRALARKQLLIWNGFQAQFSESHSLVVAWHVFQ